MRKFLSLLVILALATAFAGCPRSPRGFEYTSADLQGGWRGFTDFLAEAAGGGMDDGGTGGNAPERELVEPDVIRLVGDTLFVLNQYRGLTLVDMSSRNVLDQIPTLGYPRDLYVVGNRAYVLVAYAADFEINGQTISYDIASRLYVVDISEPEECEIVSTFTLDGDLADSRLVGNVLYAVTAEYDWSWVGGVAVKAKASASHITSVNIADENNIFEADQVSTDNIGDVVHATNTAMFVAGWNWNDDETTITYIDITDPAGDLQINDTVEVKGQVADKFKMDVYDDVLRVVSNGWQEEGRRTYITTIDLANPNDLAVLADMHFERADGETLYATRFDGTRAYVVTFLQIDPLFVIDLSDPANPIVAGELEVPGWSTHIEPRGNTLIALGVDNTDGWKVSVSLFDVTDPANPSLTDRVNFGENWSWSSAYDDVKALTVLDDVIIVPFSGWEEIGGGYDRLQFVSWSPSDLVKRGNVDLQGSIVRSFEYDDDYYGVTSEQLAQIDGADLDHPEVVHSTVLAENVADFIELSDSVGVELLTQYDTGKTIARAVNLPLKSVLGEVEVEIGQLVNAHHYGDSVVLAGASWRGEHGYTIARIDFANPASPDLVDTLELDVRPYYGFWWVLPLLDDFGDGGGGVVPGGAAGVAIDTAFWPGLPAHQQDTTFLVGDTLVLRCTADSWDETLGDNVPYEGIAIVDLPSFELSATVGFGFQAVASVNAADDKLYVSSKTYVNNITFPWNGAPLCAYFVTEFDPETIDAGPTVNVPGAFIQYDPDSDVLVLRDDQWENGLSYDSIVRSVSWNGGLGVNEIDNNALPENASVVLGRGAKLYVESYDNGVNLNVLDVSPAGALQSGGAVRVTDSWGTLIDANGSSAYFGVGGGAIARYDCTGNPDLQELVEVMGTPDQIRFGDSAAFAPLGYFGIVELPL